MVLCCLFCFVFSIPNLIFVAGAVEARLATNVLFKNVVDSTVVALVYWATGWALSFGQPSSLFAGLGEFCLVGTPPIRYAEFFFQFSFSATTATIVSGGTAGRIRILAYMMFCTLIGAVLHPLTTHWIWAPSGFLHFGGINAIFGKREREREREKNNPLIIYC